MSLSKVYILCLISVLFISCQAMAPDFSALAPVPVDFECEGSTLRTLPVDPSTRGPWAVGQKTFLLGDNNQLRTEIWYPVAPEKVGTQRPTNYDLRQFLPDADAARIPDSAGLAQECNCYTDLPLDTEFGPYPVIIMVHGTGGFRTASLPIVTHWASRGFVVLSADNPFIYLKDAKANPLRIRQAQQAQDTVDLVESLQRIPRQIQFLDGNIDVRRIGVAGHSAGGNAAAFLSEAPGVRVVIPMAANGTRPGRYLKSSMVLGSEVDGVVEYPRQLEGFAESPSPKRLIGIRNAGHLAYTELCALGRESGGLIPLVESFGVRVNALFRDLGTDGCGNEFLTPEAGWELINYATTAVYEEVLQCNSQAAAAFDNIEVKFPQLLSFEEE